MFSSGGLRCGRCILVLHDYLVVDVRKSSNLFHVVAHVFERHHGVNQASFYSGLPDKASTLAEILHHVFAGISTVTGNGIDEHLCERVKFCTDNVGTFLGFRIRVLVRRIIRNNRDNFFFDALAELSERSDRTDDSRFACIDFFASGSEPVSSALHLATGSSHDAVNLFAASLENLFCKIAASVHHSARRIDVKHNSKHLGIFHAVIERGLDSVVIVAHQSPPALRNCAIAERSVNVNHGDSIVVQSDVVAIVRFAIFLAGRVPAIFILRVMKRRRRKAFDGILSHRESRRQIQSKFIFLFSHILPTKRFRSHRQSKR